jgi:hypothetical protein
LTKKDNLGVFPGRHVTGNIVKLLTRDFVFLECGHHAQTVTNLESLKEFGCGHRIKPDTKPGLTARVLFMTFGHKDFFPIGNWAGSSFGHLLLSRLGRPHDECAKKLMSTRKIMAGDELYVVYFRIVLTPFISHFLNIVVRGNSGFPELLALVIFLPS